MDEEISYKKSVWLIICLYWSVFAIVFADGINTQVQTSIARTSNFNKSSVLQPNDILCGKGAKVNIIYQSIVESYVIKYMAAIGCGRGAVAKEAFQEIKNKGLTFVKINEKTEREEIHDEDIIIRKIEHAFRDIKTKLKNIESARKSLKRERPSQFNVSSVLKADDIYCGKGMRSCNYRGNEMYRFIVKLFCERYMSASRMEKDAVARLVLQEIKDEGLTFVYINQNNEREVIHDEEKMILRIKEGIRDAIRMESKDK